MMISPENKNDPFGLAIEEYSKFKDDKAKINVWSHLNENEHIEVSYLFRSGKRIPKLEQKALALCKGKVLDVGAAAGCHIKALLEVNAEVHAVEISSKACELLRTRFNIPVVCEDIFQWSTSEKYDTILALMNGTGIAGTLKDLPEFLRVLAIHLSEEGVILIESTDISYMFSDGDVPYPSGDQYYGEVRYRMTYKNQDSGFFTWLFVDFYQLKKCCQAQNLRCEKIYETPTHSYLAKIYK